MSGCSSRKTIIRILLLILALFPASARAEFAGIVDVPLMPTPPQISFLSEPVKNESALNIFAEISGMQQMQLCCGGQCVSDCYPNCTFNCDYEENKFYGGALPLFVTGPACIPADNDTSNGTDPGTCSGSLYNPTLSYYLDDVISLVQSVPMSFSADTGRFVAPVNSSGIPDDTDMTYFVTAGDNAGNVVSNKKNGGASPCYYYHGSWDSQEETPSFDNCSLASVKDECGVMTAGSPTCGTTYTVNDPAADTCIGTTLTSMPHADILGFSAGSGYVNESNAEQRICARIGLSAPVQDYNTGDNSDEAMMYVLFLNRSDKTDFNPYDPHVTTSYVITYIPAMQSIDPSQTLVLWDGSCISHPDVNSFDDIYDCAIIRGPLTEARVLAYEKDNELLFEVQDYVWENFHMFSNRDEVLISTAVFSIDISSEDFTHTILDSTPALRLINNNKKVNTSELLPVPPPLVDSPAITCMEKEIGNKPAMCGDLPGSIYRNDCLLSIYPIEDDTITAYNIYASREDDPDSMNLVHTLEADSSEVPVTWNYIVTTPDLDGGIFYFRVTGVSANGETPLDSAAQSWCQVQDDPWDGMRLADFACSTPKNLDRACRCEWEFDANGENPGNFGFFASKNGVTINSEAYYYDIVDGDQEEFRFTDFDPSIDYNTPYQFSVYAVSPDDIKSEEVFAMCSPEDRKAECIVAPGSLSYIPADNKLKLPPCTNTDMINGSYYIYTCGFEPGDEQQCTDIDNFSLLESSPIQQPDDGEMLEIDVDDLPDTTNVCFFVDACDACVDRGTCPSNNGASNCTSDNMSSSLIKCFDVTNIDSDAPDFPQNQIVVSDPEGSSCEISWDRVCSDSSGEFENCDAPAFNELSSYYIFRGESRSDDCDDVSIISVPELNSPIATVSAGQPTTFKDKGLVNDTTFCYRVFAVDGSKNISSNLPVPAPMKCVPKDITPPASPTVDTSIIGMEPFPCAPAWYPVSDVNEVTYNVYRCESIIQDCDASDFSLIAGSANRVLSDTVDEPEIEEYTHCVTAIDPYGNESAIFTASGSNTNCLSCSLDYRPSPPADVVVNRVTYEQGIRVWWTSSESDYNEGPGYNVYLCKDTESSISECTGPLADSPIEGDHSFKMGQAPFILNEPDVDAEGFFYITLTYVNQDNFESDPAYSSEQLFISNRSCDSTPVPEECSISVELDKAFTVVSLIECDSSDYLCYTGKFRIEEKGLEGVVVEIVDAVSGATIISRPTASDGNIGTIRLRPGTDINELGSYYVRAKIPEGSFAPAFSKGCKNKYTVSSDEYCEVDLSAVSTIESGDRLTARAPLLGNSASGGYGAEMGNPNGDGNVNLYDIAAIKYTIGTRTGDRCYRAWADLNLDGKINLLDLTVIKSNMNLEINTADSNFAPVLVESSDPLEQCCIDNSCN